VPLDRDALLDALALHVRLLKKSCAAFDEGDTDEAHRIAVELRVLLVNGSALLARLGIAGRAWFTDSSWHPDPGVEPWFDPRLLVVHMTTAGTALQAPLDDHPHKSNPPPRFAHWWRLTQPVTSGGRGRYSREFLVREMANTQAAHVDQVLECDYESLTRDHLGVRSFASDEDQVGTPARGNVVHESLRQIAWELLDTFDRQPQAVWGAGSVGRD
jgi:hypothetical protein